MATTQPTPPTPTLRQHSLIVVRVDTHAVTLEVKGVLAELCVPKLVLVQVRPAPDLGIDDVGKPLTTCHLHTGNAKG